MPQIVARTFAQTFEESSQEQQQDSTADYWSSDPYLGNEGINKVMKKNRFEEITHFLHFNDSSTEPPRSDELHDRLYKVRPILNAFNQKMLALYKRKKNISVNEGMIAFKLSDNIIMPAKPTKYGIKVWLVADASNGFVLNHKVYLGKEKNAAVAPPNGLGYNVATNISRPFYGKTIICTLTIFSIRQSF